MSFTKAQDLIRLAQMAASLSLVPVESDLLSKLREEFGVAMENGPFRDAYRLIASPKAQGLVDFRTIAGKVADVENFRGFMAAYRDRLKTENLSDLTTPKS